MNFNLSEYSSEVVGFDSTFQTENDVLIKDSSTQSTHLSEIHVSEKSIGTKEETKEIAVQANPVVLSNSNEETDRKLAAWLKKILPALEKELSEGVTEVHHQASSSSSSSFIKVLEHQEIDIKSRFSEADTICGNFIWLSVILQNNPALIISCSNKNESDGSSYVLLFEPFRNKNDGNVYWKEEMSLPIKEKLEYLVVNSENRDIFAGASKSSLYIWEYVKSSNNQFKIVEIFSKHGEDLISQITFSSDNNLICCFGSEGNLTSYKILGKQNCIVDKVMRIDEKIVKTSVAVTAIINIHKSNDFLVGLLSGHIFYCSTAQHTSQEEVFNPVLKQLTPHKFAVKSLKHVNHSNQNFVISFDAASEIFVHQLEDDSHEKSLKYVIRLPLPIKNSIAFTNNIQYIFCPLPNGNLEVFNAQNHTRRIIEQGRQSGSGILAELSKNESWLITGLYKGIFKIYFVSVDD